MATTKGARSAETAKRERRSLYPPGHQPSDDPYYLDDTLDAYPPRRRLFPGRPTAEAMEAARQLAAKRGYPMPHLPPETDGGQETHVSAAPSADGAPTDQPKRSTAPRRANKVKKK